MGGEEKTKWLREARLGMFVHWGMYSVLGRGEQIMARDLIPQDEYSAVAEQFRPADGWAERLAARAVRAGMKYVVLTTRHHDGYCLLDTATSHPGAQPGQRERTGSGRHGADRGDSMGQIGTHFAMERVIERATTTGIGALTSAHPPMVQCGHRGGVSANGNICRPVDGTLGNTAVSELSRSWSRCARSGRGALTRGGRGRRRSR